MIIQWNQTDCAETHEKRKNVRGDGVRVRSVLQKQGVDVEDKKDTEERRQRQNIRAPLDAAVQTHTIPGL